jgi:hypothetical protein
MPPKKRSKKSSVGPVLTPTSTKEQREEMEKLVDKLAEEAIARAEAKTDPLCNHRNAHYIAGELTCVLPRNHGGDHLGYVNDKPTAWSDAAGKPARQHA